MEELEKQVVELKETNSKLRKDLYDALTEIDALKKNLTRFNYKYLEKGGELVA